MTPILLSGTQWNSISALYGILSTIISIIGLYILLPGVYKVFTGYKEGHGDQLQAGGKDVVLGIAILAFGAFFLPALQNALAGFTSGGPDTLQLSGGSIGLKDNVSQEALEKLYEDNDAAGSYKTATHMGAMLLTEAFNALFNAVGAAPNIMTAEGTVNGVAIGSVTSFVQELAASLCEALKSLGFALSLLFFLTSIIEFAKEERLTLETFIKHFSKFFVAVGFVAFSDRILTACWGLGNEMAKFLGKVVALPSGGALAENSQLRNVIEWALVNQDIAAQAPAEPDLGFFAGIGNLFSILGMGLIFNIVGYILLGVMYFISFSRLIEMGTRGAFLPVAFGLIADDGWRGAGGRYLKKFIAVVAQVGILIVISRIGTSVIFMTGMSVLAGNSPFQSMAILCGIAFALISAMFKSIGWMNDAFGA